MIRTFNEWLEETEGLSLRMERAYDDLVVNPKDSVDNWKNIKTWLKSAFDAGYGAGEMNKEFLIQDLKREIRTQRQEIAALREERRFLIDKDVFPGYNADYWGGPKDDT